MERTIFFICLCIVVEGDTGKHIHIKKNLNWSQAQAYCRRYHTDLSFFNSQSEIDKLRKDGNGKLHYGWIGLQRDPNNKNAWKWSGGGHITYQNWAKGQPKNFGGVENNGLLYHDGKWYTANPRELHYFYCIDVPLVVEEKMSWEDALSHCREKQTDLPSLLSANNQLLERIEIKNITELVWIGLRFLGDRWMWVNGDPLEYDPWWFGDPNGFVGTQQGGQDHQCPVRKRCGALTKEGLWENWDCQDKLNFICV